MLVFRVRNYCLYQNRISCLIKNKKQQQKKPRQNRRSQRIRTRQREPYYLLPGPTTVTLMIKLPPYFFVQRSATSLNASLASDQVDCLIHSKCHLQYSFMIYCRFHQFYISRHLVIIHQLSQLTCRLILHDYFIDLFYFICFRARLGAIS